MSHQRSWKKQRTTYQAGQRTCYHCRQLGHVRKNCPLRQSSRSSETSQSQSSIGLIQAHIVPPCPILDQGDLFQLQGAVQVPSTLRVEILQAGRMSQDVGQGQGQSSQGGRHFRASSQAGQKAFYYCHQPGHKRRDCPQRHRSRSSGTSQSQSSVGQPQTHYLPPYPTMGQGMGQGRGQDLQARTSGTQESIYALTPQNELMDQSVAHGTFLTSRIISTCVI